jgi:broad-specificity NMP kinase
MIGMCPKCGNYEWNKQISEDKKYIKCQQCGHQWKFKAMPLFVLTGCSGVGKTTTAQELIQRDTKFITMDADFLYNIMPHTTDEDYKNWVEQIMSLSKNIMQSGKPLLWTMAGALDYFESSYNRRFFTELYFLALVCNSEDLEKRMREGRHSTDQNWINSSIKYNRWFIENGSLSGHKIDTYDITGKSSSEIADYVIQWVDAKL